MQLTTRLISARDRVQGRNADFDGVLVQLLHSLVSRRFVANSLTSEPLQSETNASNGDTIGRLSWVDRCCDSPWIATGSRWRRSRWWRVPRRPSRGWTARRPPPRCRGQPRENARLREPRARRGRERRVAWSHRANGVAASPTRWPRGPIRRRARRGARTTFGREDAPRDGMHPAVQIEAPRSRVSGVSCRVGTRRLPC
jgi:hypothetical protein